MTRRLGLLAATGGVLLGATIVIADIPSSRLTSFAPAVEQRAGQVAQTVVSGDVDLDGFVDLAVANNESNDVTVLYGAGDGAFPEIRSYTTDANPSAVQIADMNNDGVPDLVVCHDGAGTVLTLVQNEQFRRDFSAASAQLTGDGPEGLGVADFNNDGIRDVATADLFSAEGTVSVLIGIGDGTFATAVQYLTVPEDSELIASPIAITVADVNNDSQPDLLVANDAGDNVALLIGAADGTFGAPSNFEVGAAPVAIAAGDLNIDGFVDAVTADEDDSTISLLFGRGDGTFEVFAGATLVSSFPTAVNVWDYNMDGRPDVAVAGSFDEFDGISVLRGIGSTSPSGFGFETIENFPIDLEAPLPFSLAVGDLNDDFRPDVATANMDAGSEEEAVSVFLNTGDLLIGDANTDEVVNEADVRQAFQEVFDGDGAIVIQVAGGSSASGPGADGNGDTLVSAADFLAITQRIAGLASAGT